MSVAFEPKAGCMLVEVIAPEEKTASGVILPASMHCAQQSAVVVRVNYRGCEDDVNAYAVGDHVIIDYYNGKSLDLYGEQYVLVKIADVLGRLET